MDTSPYVDAYGNIVIEYNPYGSYAEEWRNQPTKEGIFRSWLQSLPWYQEFTQEYGGSPNVYDENYNYREAYLSGVVPKRYQYDTEQRPISDYVVPEGGRYHWSSQFKTDTHPTLWAGEFMNTTGIDPGALGLKSKEDANLWLLLNGYVQPSNDGG